MGFRNSRYRVPCQRRYRMRSGSVGQSPLVAISFCSRNSKDFEVRLAPDLNLDARLMANCRRPPSKEAKSLTQRLCFVAKYMWPTAPLILCRIRRERGYSLRLVTDVCLQTNWGRVLVCHPP